MAQPMGTWDRSETQEEIAQATQRVLRVREHLQTLEPPDSPFPGSMLAFEDGLTAREPLSSLVRGMRNRAVDGLEMLLDATIHEDREVMWARPMAPYALLRMSVEALGVGMWLVQHSHRAERVFRGLRLSYEHQEDARDFSLVLAGRDEREGVIASHARVVARLNELKDAVAPLRQRELTGLPSYTQMLKAVSPPVRPGETHSVDSPLVVWKMCSGFLHGNSTVMRALSDVEQMEEFAGGIAGFMLTPKWGLIASCMLVCLRELQVLDARATFLGTHDYAQRPVSAPAS